MSLKEAITGKRIAILSIAYGGAISLGMVRAPWEIKGSSLVITAAIVSGLVGWLAAGKFEALLPDDEGIYIVEYDDRENGGGKLYEVSEDQWADIESKGELHQWEQSPKRVYECVEFDAEDEEIRGNWRASKPASALNAEPTVEDALEAIRELRDEFEKMGREAQIIRLSLRSIIRDIEAERAKQQTAILDEHMAPSIDNGRSIDDLINEHIPDHVQPASVDSDDGDTDDKSEIDNLLSETELSSVVADGGRNEEE